MRKIDSRDFKCFMCAMHYMAKDMNRLQQKEAVKEITMQGSELKWSYRKYHRRVEQLSRTRCKNHICTLFVFRAFLNRKSVSLPEAKTLNKYFSY